jgi:hypothetical protein
MPACPFKVGKTGSFKGRNVSKAIYQAFNEKKKNALFGRIKGI